jgi:hypothetical protein
MRRFKMAKKIMIISMVLVLGAFVLGAPMLIAHDVTGRDVVNSGELITLEGTLRFYDSEWHLDTDEESYLLHLGPRGYLEPSKIPIESGTVVSVEGFVKGNDIAVISVAVDGETYALRDRDGFPLWARRHERFAKKGEYECPHRFQRKGWGSGPEDREYGRGPKEFQRGWDRPQKQE